MNIIRDLVKQKKKLNKLVTKAGGKVYLDARKATGTSLPQNGPLTSPWTDLVGNLNSYSVSNILGSDGNFETDSNADGLGDGWTSASVTSLSMSGNTQSFTATQSAGYIIRSIPSYTTGNVYYACAYVKADNSSTRFSLRNTEGTLLNLTSHTGSNTFEFLSAHITMTSGITSWQVRISNNSASNWTATQVKQVFYLDLTAIFGAGKEPNKQYMDWLMKDLIGKNTYFSSMSVNVGNHVVPLGMAGTTSSGVDVSDSKKPFWALDGVDDYFAGLNSTDLNVTSAPLAVFSTFYLNTPAQNGFLFNINGTLATDIQFALLYDNAQTKLVAYLEGAAKGSSSVLSTTTWYNAGYIWDGTNVKYYVNGINVGTNGSLTGSLTSRQNLRVGARASSSTANTGYVKGRIATVTVYSGSNCTEANILAAEKALSKAYIS